MGARHFLGSGGGDAMCIPESELFPLHVLPAEFQRPCFRRNGHGQLRKRPAVQPEACQREIFPSAMSRLPNSPVPAQCRANSPPCPRVIGGCTAASLAVEPSRHATASGSRCTRFPWSCIIVRAAAHCLETRSADRLARPLSNTPSTRLEREFRCCQKIGLHPPSNGGARCVAWSAVRDNFGHPAASSARHQTVS